MRKLRRLSVASASVSSAGTLTPEAVYVLDDNNTVWRGSEYRGEFKWERLPGLPEAPMKESALHCIPALREWLEQVPRKWRGVVRLDATLSWSPELGKRANATNTKLTYDDLWAIVNSAELWG